MLAATPGRWLKDFLIVSSTTWASSIHTMPFSASFTAFAKLSASGLIVGAI